jgi:hypothetical protein
MRHNRAIVTFAGATILAAGTALLLPMAAQAAVPCNESALVTAANAAGGGAVTLPPGCTYSPTASHGNDGVNGPTGLPLITAPIILEGNASTITPRHHNQHVPHRTQGDHPQRWPPSGNTPMVSVPSTAPSTPAAATFTGVSSSVR